MHISTDSSSSWLGMWSLPDSPEPENWPGKIYQGPAGDLFLQLYMDPNNSLLARAQSQGSIRLIGKTELPVDFDGPHLVTVGQAILRSWNTHNKWRGKQGLHRSLYLFRLENLFVGQWFSQSDIRFSAMILSGQDWEQWCQSATWVAQTKWAQVSKTKYSRKLSNLRLENSIALRLECLEEDNMSSQLWVQLMEGVRVLASLGMGYEVGCEHIVFPFTSTESPEFSYETRLWTSNISPNFIQDSHRKGNSRSRFVFDSLGNVDKPETDSQNALEAWLEAYLQAPRGFNGVLATLTPSGSVADQRDLIAMTTGIEAFYRFVDHKDDKEHMNLKYCLDCLMGETQFYQEKLPEPVPLNFEIDIRNWRNRISHGMKDVPLDEMYQGYHMVILRLLYQARLMRFLGFSEEFILSQLSPYSTR